MIDFSKIKTYSIKKRKHKESFAHFPDPRDSIDILNNKDLRELADKIVEAHSNNKQVIFMLGGHVIKTGMSSYIIDLMKKGVITHIAMNGSTSIHDFEIAAFGETSEDVQAGIKNGTFGMVEETGSLMNSAINEGAGQGKGYGYSVAKKISELGSNSRENSILYTAYTLNMPVSVHVAIGTDTIHQHPMCRGELLGAATYADFKLFADSISKLEGGAVVNIGSAVVLPETFLKALTMVRNLGYDVKNITTANLDMNDHYRPRLNVVERPVKALGGQGFIIIEKHQKTVPSLHRLIVQGLGKGKGALN